MKLQSRYLGLLRISLLGFSSLTILALSGCKTTPVGKYQVVEFDRQGLEESLCGGIFESEQKFENGSGQATTLYYELANGQRVNNKVDFIKAEGAREIAHMKSESQRFIAFMRMKSDEQFAEERARFNALPERQRLDESRRILNFDGKNDSTGSIAESIAKIKERIEKLKPEFAEYDRKAGGLPFVESSSVPIKKAYLAPRKVGTLDGIQRHRIPQISSNTCWAASLQTAFQFLGYPYTQEQFLASFKASCPRRRSKTASLNQMLFAASTVYSNGRGVWIEAPQKMKNSADDDSNWTFYLTSPSDYGFVQSLLDPHGAMMQHQAMMQQLPVFRKGKTWDSTIYLTEGQPVRKGQIKVIETTAELIQAVSDKHVVIVGRRTPGGGHTVVISGISYYPGGNYNAADNVYEMDHRAHLEEVSYLDPSTITIPKPMSGNDFLASMVFAFYIQKPR